MNIIGLDLGTTTLSAVVADSENGVLRDIRNIPNGADLPPRMEGERIQDADVIADKALQLTGELMTRHEAAAIGLDGQMHGLLYVDGEGRAVSPLVTWQDQRGEAPLAGTTFAGELSRRTGHPMATGYGMTTHFWHVVNGRVPENAESLCTIADYIGMKLTGRTRPLMHLSNAAGMGPADVQRGTWDAGAMKKAGIDTGILPEVTDRLTLLGRTPEGIPVACAIGDNQASFLGSVREPAGTVLVNMGTGGQVSMLAAGQRPERNLEIRPLGDGQAIAVGSVICGGRSYALLEAFLRSCAALAGAEDAPLYEAMNRIGLELLDSPDLPAVDTRFGGTRARPDLRGAISGIGTENFDAGHLIAGTLLGMAREMHGLYDRMLTGQAVPAVRMVGSGNALRRNPALRKAFEAVFGMRMRIPLHTEEAAYGAALAGMVAAGFLPSLGEAQRLIRYRES